MKENIFEAIRLQSGKIAFKNLLKKFDIDHDELNKLLLELKLEGRILQIGNKYMLFPKDCYIGTVSLSSGGKKYLYTDNERISIASDFFNEVILNDVVCYRFNSRNEAEIVSIIDRTLGKMTCEVMFVNGKKKAIPYHGEINISLPKDVMENLYEGDIILVDTTPNELGEYSDAKFIRKIGNRSDPSIKDTEIALNYQFDNDYSNEYMDEIANYPKYVKEDDIINRRDFRNQASFTIDGIDTKDMDDGVYAENIGNNMIRVYVHIADVSHYVKTNSWAFKRACEKGTSLYMNNSVFHMLHQNISNGICSLNPYEDRLTKTVIMDIDEYGNIVNFEIVKSVINSKIKMNYDDVDKILMDNEIVNGYEPFVDTLSVLNEAAARLNRRYTEENGKINFGNNELHITYNRDGTISKIEDSQHSQSRALIENLMVAANETIASWFYNLQIPTVYRIHEFPNVTKINQIIDEVNKSGYNIKHINDADNPKTIQKLLNKFEGKEGFSVISQLLVTSMQRAKYSTDNLGHYALGLDSYLHFTSPIRRLPDLLVHMMTDLVLEHYDKLDNEFLDDCEKILHDLSIHSSKMERQAELAEAAAEKRLIIEKLSHSIGEEMEAVVCETSKFMRIKLLGMDLFVDNAGLSDNFYYDKKRKLYYDTDSDIYLKMGTKVIVRLTDVNTANESINVRVLSTVNTNTKKKTLKKQRVV